MNFRLILITALAATTLARAQFLTFGVEGGVPAQTPFRNTSTMPFLVGPVVEIRPLPHLSFQTGVLFRRLGEATQTLAFTAPSGSLALASQSWSGRTLEIPLLAKVRLLDEQRTFRPFLTAGPTIRRTSIKDTFLSSAGTGLFPNYRTHRTEWNVDPSAGAGVDIRAGRFHIEPEVRYSYWQSGTNYPLRKNQVDFLLRFRR